MLNYRPKMFHEASDTQTSKDIIFILISFVIVFAVILFLESIIPDRIYTRLVEQKLAEHSVSNSVKEIISHSDKRVMIPYLFGTAFGTIISVIYCRFIEARPISSMGARKKGFFAHYFSGLTVGAVLMSAIVLITKLSGAGSITLCENVDNTAIVLYFLGFVVQGMSEEFIFRGYLLNSIGGAGYHTMLAVMAASVGHSISHILNNGFGVMPFFNLTLLSMFLCLYMILSDNIWGVSAIHTVWNFTQGNVYGISVSGSGDMDSIMRTTAISDNDLITGGKFGAEGSIFTTATIGLGIMILGIMYYRRSKSSNTNS